MLNVIFNFEALAVNSVFSSCFLLILDTSDINPTKRCLMDASIKHISNQV